MNEYDRVTAKRDEWKARAEAAENKLANAEAEIEELRAAIRDLNAIRNSFNARWDRVVGKEVRW